MTSKPASGQHGGKPPPTPLSDAQWRERLSPLAYNVTRKRLTEPANGSTLLAEARPGSYRCACCDAPLFGSAAKFDAGDGWPAFREALAPGVLSEHEDLSWFAERTAVRCAACDAHLGHLVPADAGARRYRINGCALAFGPS